MFAHVNSDLFEPAKHYFSDFYTDVTPGSVFFLYLFYLLV